jgi:CheY-like chemotaxis protein
MKGDMQNCLDAGCDDYLTKPIVREKFLGTIASYLKQSAPANEAVATSGDGNP